VYRIDWGGGKPLCVQLREEASRGDPVALNPMIGLGFTKILYHGTTELLGEKSGPIEISPYNQKIAHQNIDREGWESTYIVRLLEAVYMLRIGKYEVGVRTNKKPAAGYCGTSHGAICICSILALKYF
jgi:hypothetical protein